MSFGWAAGDIITGINIVQNVISAIKDGPAEYREIHRELLSLNIALKSVQESADDPGSLLTRKGQPRKQELLEILANCRKVVDEVQSLINKHSRLQTRGRSIKRVWDAYRVGSTDLDTLRGRLTFYTSTIDMFLHSLEGPALARIEGMVRMLVANMGITPNVAGSSRMSIASVASTATILSILDPDQEGEAWKFLRAELMADGILPSHLATNQTEIISYLKALIEGVEAPQTSPVSNEAMEPVGPNLNLDSVPTSGSVSSDESYVYEVKTDDAGFFNYRPAVVRYGVTDNGKKSALLFCVEVSPIEPPRRLIDTCHGYYFELKAGNKSQRFASTGHYPQAGQLNGREPWHIDYLHSLTWRLWPRNIIHGQGFKAFRLAALFDMGMHRPNEPVKVSITLDYYSGHMVFDHKSIVEFAITNETFQQPSPTILEAQDLVNAASGTYVSHK